MPQNKNHTHRCLSGREAGEHDGICAEGKTGFDREYAPRYRQADRKTKSGILDEYVRLTGYHQKYAMALLTRWGITMRIMVDGKPVKLKAGTMKQRRGAGENPGTGLR
jgi:hypothetical protein